MNLRGFRRQMNRAPVRRITHSVTTRQSERTAALVALASSSAIARTANATDPATGKIAFVWGLSAFTPFEVENDTWRML